MWWWHEASCASRAIIGSIDGRGNADDRGRTTVGLVGKGHQSIKEPGAGNHAAELSSRHAGGAEPRGLSAEVFALPHVPLRRHAAPLLTNGVGERSKEDGRRLRRAHQPRRTEAD